MTDQRDASADIHDALLVAGIAVGDEFDIALSEFKPSYSGESPSGQRLYTRDGRTTTLERLAASYAESRPFLCAAKPEPEPEAPADPYDSLRPRYSDGSLVPGDQLSVEEDLALQTAIDAAKAAEARGPQPEPRPIDRTVVAAAFRREAEQAAREAEQRQKQNLVGDGHVHATDLPDGALSEFRNLYSDEPTLDELYEAAGDYAGHRRKR